MDPDGDAEIFKGQVHHDQHTIQFCPKPGDIIVRKVVNPPTFQNDHANNCILATFGLVELYKDNFYAYPERCPDPAKRAAYHRIFFRNGDHIIRRGRFSQEHNYEYRDEDFISIWVYWPGYQFHTTFVRLISTCSNLYGTRFFEPQLSQYRSRPQSYRFEESEVNWEPGDLILRWFEPGPPGAPNPGWHRLLGVQQVADDSDMSYAKEGDLLIKHKGRPEPPTNPGNPVNANTRMEIYCYMLTREDVDEDSETEIGGGDRWMYMCGDSMLFDFNDWDSVLRFSKVNGVPQPADIMISQNEEFTVFDEKTEIGGFVKFYQNAATSVDTRDPRTIVYKPTRVPEDGDTPWAAEHPNLPTPELQAGWLEPNWDHLSVPVPEAAHPIVFRFGRWAEESNPHTEPIYRWIWNPHVEMYQRHQRSVDGRTFFMADRTGVNYGEGRDHPAWEEFQDHSLSLHFWGPMDEFPVLQGDCIIRRDLRNNVHPTLTHGLMPATNEEGDLRCCPGDLLVRYGLIREDEDQHREDAAGGGNRYHFGVELYVLVLGRQLQPVWQFRGRDQVIFGFIPKPIDKKKKLPLAKCRLLGLYNGSTYYYDAPGSQTTRSWQLAIGGGAGIFKVKPTTLYAEDKKGKEKQEEDEGPDRKTQYLKSKPDDEKKSKKKTQVKMESIISGLNIHDEGSSSNSENNKEKKPNNMPKINVIEATRTKLRHEVIFPTFPNHETGNYRRDFQGDH